MKECRVCHKPKELGEFSLRPGAKDGHRSECKICLNARMRLRYRENPDAFKRRTERWKSSHPEKAAEAERKAIQNNMARLKANIPSSRLCLETPEEAEKLWEGRRKEKIISDATERFWDKVRVGSPDECWEWQALRQYQGYGQFKLSQPRRQVQAHRFAWELTNGPIPDGMMVCHECDNPPCCNPCHLFLGFHVDNMADMAQKGHLKGTRNPKAILTPHDIFSIRDTYSDGCVTQRDIAEVYGVNSSTINAILTGRNWGHIKDGEGK